MRATPNSGVALIMVLGLLTVMILMAVTFAISMRTERLAAGNAADTVRARELVHVGLARAMDDLAVKLGTNGLMSQAGGTNYPPWNATNSYTNTDGLGTARFPTNIYLLRGEATNYVPRALWDAATNADWLNPSNHWLAVESLIYTNSGSAGYLSESNLMGRVAYLILNCSGLLDANYAGSVGSTRGVGTNPSELAIGNMPEFAGAAAFLAQRDSGANPDYRYETLDELTVLNASSFNGFPSNLFVYSRALPGYWNTNVNPAFNCVGTQVNLNGSAADLIARRTEITNAFTNIGFGPFEAGVLFSNLIDYVDSDSIPTNFEYCVENVPMINEVVVSNELVVADPIPNDAGFKSYTINGGIYIEACYPFVTDSQEDFKIRYTAKFGGVVKPGDVVPAPKEQTFPIKPTANSMHVFYETLSGGPFPHVSEVANISIISTVDVQIVWQDGATWREVDRLKNPIVLTNRYSSGTTIGRYSHIEDMECSDPRFNYEIQNPFWSYRTNQHSMGQAMTGVVNNYTLASKPADEDFLTYVANGRICSVAELGYLVYTNSPWKTVKLYGPNCHRVLDVFGLSTNTSDILMTNTVYRGLVNCNPNVATDATAAVFAGMPVDQYPGGPSNAMSMSEAQTFVSRLFGKGICTNLSDIGRNLNSADFTYPPGMNELERESYFRNAINLLNLRQNVFTIIIEAQAASGGNIPRNPARQRAVAIVWRDPYTGEMFVRHIKWLGD